MFEILLHNVSMRNYEDLLKKRIKEIRHMHKLSQSQVAKKLGYKIHTYKNLEREIAKGGIVVTGRHILDLCEAYNINDSNYFIFGKKIERDKPEFYFDKR